MQRWTFHSKNALPPEGFSFLFAIAPQLLPHLRRGWALWKVGQRSFLVQHRLSSAEREIVDTDARMLVAATA